MKIEKIIQLFRESFNIKKNVFVFGESHFHKDEIQNIRKQILKINPEIILHEFPNEEKKYFSNIKVLSIENSFNKDASLKKQFLERETNMIQNIKNVVSQQYSNIVVVVGDTHLRTIYTEELGKPTLFNFLQSIDAKIIRSNYPEIY